MFVLLIFYLCVASSLPIMTYRATLAIHFAHACAWCLFHNFGLGLLLRAQSQSKYIVRHFLKNYHYPPNDNGDGAVQEAFTNWKGIYNLSLCMTYCTSLTSDIFVWLRFRQSIARQSCMEDVYLTQDVDRRGRITLPYAWGCRFLSPWSLTLFDVQTATYRSACMGSTGIIRSPWCFR